MKQMKLIFVKKLKLHLKNSFKEFLRNQLRNIIVLESYGIWILLWSWRRFIFRNIPVWLTTQLQRMETTFTSMFLQWMEEYSK